MNSPVHPDIETFYKSFSIFSNMTVSEKMVVYTRQTHRIEVLAEQARDIILTKHLSLDVVFNKVYHTITVKVIGELDRMDNAWGSIVEKLGKLQDQL